MAVSRCSLSLHRSTCARRQTVRGATPKKLFRPALRSVRVQHRSSAVASSAPASVTFRINYRAEFGQVLKVVGEPTELGGWSAKEAPALEWGEGNEWSATVEVPAGTHEFKVVVAAQDGQSAIWEGGPNRSLKVDGAAGDTVAVVCRWGITEAELVPGGLHPAGGAEADSEGEAPLAPADLPGGGDYPGADTDDEGSISLPPEGGDPKIGKLTVEGRPKEAGKSSEVGKMTVEVGKMTVEGGDESAAGPVEAGSEGEAPLQLDDLTGSYSGADTDDLGTIAAPADQGSAANVGKMTVEGHPGSSASRGAEVGNAVSDSSAAEGAVNVRLQWKTKCGVSPEESPRLESSVSTGEADQLESPVKQVLNNFLKAFGMSGSDGDDQGSGGGGGGSGSASNRSGLRRGPRPARALPLAAVAAVTAGLLAVHSASASTMIAPPRGSSRFFRGPRQHCA